MTTLTCAPEKLALCGQWEPEPMSTVKVAHTPRRGEWMGLHYQEEFNQ